MADNNFFLTPLPRLFDTVAQKILNHMYATKMKPGDRLPTERELSEQLAVSRSSVREGLRILEVLGFLEPKRGRGTIVRKPLPLIIPQNLFFLPNQKQDPAIVQLWLLLTVEILKQLSFIDKSNEVNQELREVRERSAFFQVIEKWGSTLREPFPYDMWFYLKQSVQGEVNTLQYDNLVRLQEALLTRDYSKIGEVFMEQTLLSRH